MRVRLKCQRVGNFGEQNPGDVIDISVQEAARLVSVGQAEYLDQPKQVVETASLASQLREPSPKARVKRIAWN